MMLQICSVVVMKIASIYWIWQAKQMEKEEEKREWERGNGMGTASGSEL